MVVTADQFRAVLRLLRFCPAKQEVFLKKCRLMPEPISLRDYTYS
jgi:hypothetical protein